MTTQPLAQTGATPAVTESKSPARLIRNSLIGAAAAALCLGALAAPASADPLTSGQSTTAHVGVTAGITMTGLTPSFTLTGTPGSTQTGVGAVTFNVETNNVAGYAVTVQSTAATMLPADTGANMDSIPIAALTVRETGGSTFDGLSSTAALQVHTQAERSANGGDSLSNDFRLRIPVVNADTYSATLNYVASTL